MKTAQEVIQTQYQTDKTGRSPTPAYKRKWSKLRKLTWRASLIMAKHPGTRIYIMKGRLWIDGVFQHDLFSISYNNAGMSAMAYETAWDILTGFDLGLETAEWLKEKI